MLVQKTSESEGGSNTVPVVTVPVGPRSLELGRWDECLGEFELGVVLLERKKKNSNDFSKYRKMGC